MKYLILVTLFSISAFAQNDQPDKQPPKDQGVPQQVETKPKDAELQKQEESLKPENLNDFEVGPYDQQGNYEFFNRSKLEARQGADRSQSQ